MGYFSRIRSVVHPHQGGDLLVAQADEEPQLHDLGLLGILDGQRFQGVVDLQQALVFGGGSDLRGVQPHALQFPSLLEPELAPGQPKHTQAGRKRAPDGAEPPSDRIGEEKLDFGESAQSPAVIGQMTAAQGGGLRANEEIGQYGLRLLLAGVSAAKGQPRSPGCLAIQIDALEHAQILVHRLATMTDVSTRIMAGSA